jgi:diguanylate cyclase (GGDEF)-like protein
MSFDLTQKLGNNFVALCDRYLFSGWQHDDAILFRARTLIGLLIVYQFIVIAGSAFALFLSSLPTAGNAAAVAILLGVFLCFNWLMHYVARSGELMQAAHFAVATAFIGIEAGILVSGGPLLSPSLGVAVVPPVVAFCLIGRRAGLIWAAIAFVTQLSMILLGGLGIDYVNLIVPEQMGMNRLFNWTVVFSAVIGIVLVYETANNHLQRDRDQQYQRFQHLALHDALTGLANRKKFTDRLRYALAALARSNKILAVVYLDLNGFKQINDRLGHESGDKVLQIIAQRLLDTVRACDTVARLGGDEFAVLLEDINDQADAEQTVQRLQKAISEPMEALHDYPIHASFGVALAPEHAGDADTLLLMADQAMYDAKKQQRDFRVYNPARQPADKNLAKKIRSNSSFEKKAAANKTLSHRLRRHFINHSNQSLPPHKLASSDQLFRGRILVGCLRFCQVVAVVFLLNLWTLHELSPSVRVLIGALLVTLLGVITLASFYARRSGNTAGVATVLVACGFAAIESAILFTGGPAVSTAADIALIPPLAAFCLNGRRHGMAWAGITVVVHVAMLVAESFFGLHVPTLPKEQLGNAQIINWTVSFISTVGVLFIFEMLYQRLQHERDKQRAQLEYLATHDPLTGVANRRQFFNVLQGAVERMLRNDSTLAVAYLDLDNFKPVNDTLGHDIGDIVLQTIAQRLRENVRNIDTVARLGGDEFGIIMENVGDLDNAIAIAAKMQQIVSQPIVGLETLPVGSSIGISIAPLHSTNGDALVRMADRAMLRAKTSGAIATYEI